MDGAVEECTAIVLETVLEVASLAGEHSFHKELMLLECFLAHNLVVVLVKVPRVVYRRVSKLNIESHAQLIEPHEVLVVVGRNHHRETNVLALGLLELEHGAQGVVKAVDQAALGVVDFR